MPVRISPVSLAQLLSDMFSANTLAPFAHPLARASPDYFAIGLLPLSLTLLDADDAALVGCFALCNMPAPAWLACKVPLEPLRDRLNARNDPISHMMLPPTA